MSQDEIFDCKHCDGTGRCNCVECVGIASGKIDKKTPLSGKVVCSACFGIGKRNLKNEAWERQTRELEDIRSKWEPLPSLSVKEEQKTKRNESKHRFWVSLIGLFLGILVISVGFFSDIRYSSLRIGSVLFPIGASII